MHWIESKFGGKKSMALLYSVSCAVLTEVLQIAVEKIEQKFNELSSV